MSDFETIFPSFSHIEAFSNSNIIKRAEKAVFTVGMSFYNDWVI